MTLLWGVLLLAISGLSFLYSIYLRSQAGSSWLNDDYKKIATYSTFSRLFLLLSAVSMIALLIKAVLHI